MSNEELVYTYAFSLIGLNDGLAPGEVFSLIDSYLDIYDNKEEQEE